MDYVARQFVNLTKKFRKESRKALAKFHDAIEKNTKAVEKAAEAQKEQSQANALVTAAVNFPRSRIHEYCAREKSRNPMAWLKLAIEVATLFVLVAYTSLTAFQLLQLKISADAANSAAVTAAKQLELTDRPWVTIDASITAPLTYDGKAVRIAFSFVPKNIGRSPAQGVLIVPELIPAFMGDDVREEQKRICDGAAQVNPIFPKYVLFPNEPFLEPFGLDLSNEAINSHWGKLPPGMKAPDPIPIALVGCVDYTYETSPKHHQTGFALDVIMKNQGLPLKSLTPLSPSSLILRQHAFGGHFAN
jgi:hypothetical protein